MPEPTTNKIIEPEQEIELLDDQQEIAELAGKITRVYVYETRGAKGPEYALSKAGVNWACRQLAAKGEAIRVVGHPEIKIDPTSPEHVLVSVIAERVAIKGGKSPVEIRLDSDLGSKRQWVKMQLRNGNVVADEKWYEKSVSKATRNAKRKLLEDGFVEEIIREAVKQEKFIRIGEGAFNPDDAGQGRAPSLPPPLAKEPPKEPGKPAATTTPSAEETPVQRAARKARERANEAAAKKGQAAAPTALVPEAAPPAEKSTAAVRQKLGAIMAVCGFKEEDLRKRHFRAWLPGRESSKECTDAELQGLIDALFKLNGGDAGYELVPVSDDGILWIVSKTDGGVVYPRGGKLPPSDVQV